MTTNVCGGLRPFAIAVVLSLGCFACHADLQESSPPAKQPAKDSRQCTVRYNHNAVRGGTIANDTLYPKDFCPYGVEVAGNMVTLPYVFKREQSSLFFRSCGSVMTRRVVVASFPARTPIDDTAPWLCPGGGTVAEARSNLNWPGGLSNNQVLNPPRDSILITWDAALPSQDAPDSYARMNIIVPGHVTPATSGTCQRV